MRFLDEVHQLASQEKVESANKFKELLAKLLHHQGDWMDKVPTDKISVDCILQGKKDYR